MSNYDEEGVYTPPPPTFTPKKYAKVFSHVTLNSFSFIQKGIFIELFAHIWELSTLLRSSVSADRHMLQRTDVVVNRCVVSGAWPVLIDDFVEYARPLVQGGGEMES